MLKTLVFLAVSYCHLSEITVSGCF